MTFSNRGRRPCAATCALLAAALLWMTAAPVRAQSSPARAQSSSARAQSPRPAAGAKTAARQGGSARWRAALERVSVESLRGHLTYISSDALEGRKTPSKGLDLAAEYIATQFRRAGLEPAGDDGYFQTANWKLVGRDPNATRLDFTNAGGAAPSLRSEQVGVGFSVAGFNFWTPDAALSLKDARLLKVNYASVPAGLTRAQVEGRVVVTEFPEFPRGNQARAFQLLREENEFMTRMHALGATLVVTFDRRMERARGGRASRLVDPEGRTGESPLGSTPSAPLLIVYGAEAARFFDALPEGEGGGATLNLNLPAPSETPVHVRNVAGLLRGSDPSLRDTYVIVSAHYDHLGVRENCDASKEDCVYNGANDDGSGTVGVVELAGALAHLKPRPRRSIIFMTFFGEELGLVGSRYYGRHPLVPLVKTVAQINMEQVGRTDDSEGPQVGTLAVTGFDYSDVGAALQRAGEAEGVRVFKHPTKSDAYFSRSDNQSLADAGVPAHTASVAFQFPDYHAVGDEVSKIDFDNMARVVRAVGRAVLDIADSQQEPRWNEQNPKAAPYVEAWKKLHGQ